MEKGKVEISAWTIPLLAQAVDIPISYFYPWWVVESLAGENLSEIEQSVLINFRKITLENDKKIIIQFIRALNDFREIVSS